MHRHRLVALIVLALLARPLWAQNFVVNGDFDAGTDGWTRDLAVTAVPFSPDWSGSSDSDAVKLSFNLSLGRSGSLSQCVDVAAQDVDFSFYSYFGPGKASLSAFEDADCAPESASATFDTLLSTPDLSQWYRNESSAIALPAGTRSVRVAFTADASSGMQFIDHVQLRPAGQIFQSSFDAAEN